jgi:hypothetical protein
MEVSPNKKQLRHELATIEELISRYGGDIPLWTAHDNVAVELDLYCDSVIRRKKEISEIKKLLRSINHGRT